MQRRMNRNALPSEVLGIGVGRVAEHPVVDNAIRLGYGVAPEWLFLDQKVLNRTVADPV